MKLVPAPSIGDKCNYAMVTALWVRTHECGKRRLAGSEVAGSENRRKEAEAGRGHDRTSRIKTRRLINFRKAAGKRKEALFSRARFHFRRRSATDSFTFHARQAPLCCAIAPVSAREEGRGHV